MIRFEQLHLQNHIVFTDLVWQMDKYPLSVIRGRNLDRRSRSANTVGKSLLAASLTNLLTEAPPIAVRKRAASDLVFGKSRVELSLRNGDTPWRLCQFAAGKSVKYEIYRQNKSLAVKDIATARKFISQAVPFADEHVYSQIYVSSFRPSILSIGSATQRADYFESIFELRIYDQMRRSLLNELQQINQHFTQAEVLRRQREELTPQLQARDLAGQIQRIQRRHQELLQENTTLSQQIAQLSSYVTLAEQITSAASLQALQTRRRKLDARLIRAREQLERQQRRLGAQKTQLQLYKSRRKLTRRLAKLPHMPAARQLAARQDKLHRQIQRGEDIVATYLRYEKPIVRYKSLLDRLHAAPPDAAVQHERLIQAKYLLRQRRQLRPNKPCPLCGQPVDQRRHRHDLRQLRRKLRRLNQAHQRAREAEFCRKVQAKLPAAVLQADINQLQAKLAGQRQAWQKLHQQLTIARQRRQLHKRLRQLPLVEKLPRLRRDKLRRLQRRINQWEESRDRISQDIRLLHKLAAMPQEYDNLPAAKRALAGLKSTLSQLSPQLTKISDRLHRLSADHAEQRGLRRQLRDINAELTKLDEIVANRDVLEALAQAYSTKGIRVMQINALAGAYANMLNKYAATLYPEPIKFHAEVAANTFNIIAERHNKISDVRALSGSESRQFLAISALALISLMPDNLRCSHLILDELEVGVAPADRHLFTNEFIPMLTATIPHVVVITPLSIEDMPIPNAKELVLVRKNGVSQWAK